MGELARAHVLLKKKIDFARKDFYSVHENVSRRPIKWGWRLSQRKGGSDNPFCVSAQERKLNPFSRAICLAAWQFLGQRTLDISAKKVLQLGERERKWREVSEVTSTKNKTTTTTKQQQQ